jgi:hypothetical protein
MTVQAARLDRSRPLEQGQLVVGTLDRPLVIFLGEGNLFFREVAVSRDRCPGRSRVSTAQELIVFGFVTLSTVLRRQVLRDYEAFVVELILTLDWFVTVQTVHVLRCVLAHLELMYDGRGLSSMTLGTLAGCLDQARRRLIDVTSRATAIQQKTSHNQGRAQKNGDEY